VSQFSEDVRKGIAIFLVITFALSSIFYTLIILKPPTPYVTALMWCPALGALLTCLLLRINISEWGWKWGKTRYQLLAYVIPIAFLFGTYVVVWLSGFGGFPNLDAVREIANTYGWEKLPTGLIIAFYVLLHGTYGMAEETAMALGEEIGWRGFLVPQLAKVTTFTKTAVISGLIWAVWHYPITPTVYAQVNTPIWYQFVSFTILAIAVSFPLAWIRLKSGSVWAAAFLHASYNLFGQSIFSRLTADTGITDYLLGDLGIATAIGGVAVALIFWPRRAEVEGVPRDAIAEKC
jgi:membrane protease YdiL (CAAX protease family)